MEDNVQKLADMGRFEDDQLAHVATGEMIVPPVISPNTRMMIEQDMLNQGMDPNQYIVGGNPSINPRTGLQEFFIKKLFKKIKKVVKKVAPVAGALFIPGVGGVLSKGLGAVGSKLGIKAGLGSKFLGGKGFLDTAAAVRRGIGGLSGFNRGQQTSFDMVSSQLDPETNTYVDQYGNKVDAATYKQYLSDPSSIPTVETGPLNMPFGPMLRKRFLGDNSQPIFEQLTDSEKKDGFNFGEQGGLMGLATLFGLATKRAAEKTEGGLRDIRLSTRPDLMPQQVFQGFDTGVRPGMSYGGALGYRPGMSYGGPMDEDELDLRIGGPSIGPGTETSDDIPAMLSDGEFVMTAAANKGLGGFKIEKNKDSLTIFPTGKPDREQGFKNNDKLMKFFENYQDMMS